MTFPRAVLIAFAAFTFVPIIANAQDGWLLFRADARRTGTASKLPAWEKRVAWQRPLLNDKLLGLGGEVQDQDDAAKELIDKLRKNADPTTLPGSFPIIAKNQCVYRSYRGVRSVALQEITVNDETSDRVEKLAASRIVWKSIPHNRSLVFTLRNPQVPGWVTASVDGLQKNKQEHWVYVNPMIGSLSADDENIYSINDFPFPSENSFKKIDGKLREVLRRNELTADSSYSGKLVWDIGRLSLFNDPEFTNGVFLGAPLPLNRRLLVLNECTGDAREMAAGNLRLMSIDPTPKQMAAEYWGPTLKQTQVLMKIPVAEQIRNHPLRRTQPLHIAHADGLLVCPTHAGVLFGVDRDKLAVRWQYRYRAQNVAAPTLPLWQAACPIIHKDRIVFTAADAPDIHCIDLKGVKQWSKPADNDLYLATVTDDIVLLVGKTHCRALALADGAVKWKIGMGLPAGVGVKDGSIYYVPLKRDAVTKGPTIWGIDLAKGKKASGVEAPYPDALGNLALHRGMFVSQSVTHIAEFPLAAKKN